MADDGELTTEHEELRLIKSKHDTENPTFISIPAGSTFLTIILY